MPAHPSANDRLKQSFPRWIWSGITAAVVLHVAILVFWPQMSVAEMSTSDPDIRIVSMPEPPLPEPPADIARPAAPVLTDNPLLQDATIAPTTIDQWPSPDLAPLTAPVPTDQGYIVWVPTMIRPELLNRDEVIREMERRYPAFLRQAGVGGRTVLTLLLDRDGVLRGAEIAQPSGHAALDAAALEVIDIARFSPATNRDRAVAVRIRWPIDWVPTRR